MEPTDIVWLLFDVRIIKFIKTFSLRLYTQIFA